MFFVKILLILQECPYLRLNRSYEISRLFRIGFENFSAFLRIWSHPLFFIPQETCRLVGREKVPAVPSYFIYQYYNMPSGHHVSALTGGEREAGGHQNGRPCTYHRGSE